MKLGAVRAALPARERRGRRAPRPLFLHRLRRRPRGAARRAGLHARRRAPRGPRDGAELLAGCARRWRTRRSRSRRSPACRSRAAWSASPPTMWCASSSGCRSAQRGATRRAGAALRRAALAAGVRSPDAAASRCCMPGARRERRALRREVVQALRGGLPTVARAGALLAADARARRAPTTCAGVRRTQEYIAAGDVYQLVLASALRRPARARSLPGLPRAAADQPFALHVLLRARRRHGRRLLARGAGQAQRAAQAQLRPIAGTRPRARRRRRAMRRARPSCAPTPRKTPST